MSKNKTNFAFMNEQLLRIGEAVTGYYSQLHSAELTEKDFILWINSLEEPMRMFFQNKGLDNCKGILNFQRFILEVKDKGMDEYLKSKLTDEDFNYWIAKKEL